jgi:dihydrofolate reductase
MRNVLLLMHVSLDGFVAGPNGEMDWIQMDDEIIADVAGLTASADSALFGRVTYEMMAGYWPTAADSPDATQHDLDHARWVNPAPKYVFSRTLDKADWQNTHFIRGNIGDEIARLKAQPGKNLLMIGSARTAHSLMQQGLIDEFRINVNPVVLGGGLPLFADLTHRLDLDLVSAKGYGCGVVGLHYRRSQ